MAQHFRGKIRHLRVEGVRLRVHFGEWEKQEGTGIYSLLSEKKSV